MSDNLRPLPLPGINGDYEDSCVVCGQGTDTGLAFVGPAEWAITGLTLLGIPEGEVRWILAQRFGCAPGVVPAGEVTVPVRLCQECVDDSPVRFPVGLVATGIPRIKPPIED